MKRKNKICTLILSGLLSAFGFLLFPGTIIAQEEVASSIMRYKQYEVSTGYYEEYEAKPQRQRPFVEVPGLRRGIFPYSPAAAGVRNRSRLTDSHQGLQFYDRRRCEDCHVEQTRGRHTVRANLTCRQCHEGVNASFAGYVVHEPSPYMDGTLKTFPVLFYAFWIMIAIAVGTFVVFLPHTILWGLRELMSKKGGDRK